MKHEFRLADIGEGLEEAEIISWLVQVGDVVERDQPLIEVMTDKSNAELPAPTAGTIVSLGGDVGDILHVGAMIAVIDGATTPTTGDTSPSLPRVQGDVAPMHITATSTPQAASESVRVKASPSTRREASARGIDLTTIAGTGPGGRILLADLESTDTADQVTPPQAPSQPRTSVAASHEPPRPAAPAATAPAAASSRSGVLPPVPQSPALDASVALRGVRRAIAANMTQSWSEIPHIHAFEHIDAEALISTRAQIKATGRPEYQNLTPLAFFVAAVASALRSYPQANASLDMAAETITNHPHVNVGVAVAAPAGLVVPVLHHVETQDFVTVASNLRQLVVGAREGSLTRDQFTGGTATVTNFGSLGGEQATPLIRPPESVILGFGSAAERPFVVNGQVVARKTMHIVIGADHRLIDGDIATAIIRHIAELLTHPLRLVL